MTPLTYTQTETRQSGGKQGYARNADILN